jgi:hypothetical protein
VAVRVGALAVAVGLMAGCSVADDGGRDYNPDHQPGYVVPESDLPGTPGPAPTWPGGGTGLGLPGIGQADPSEPDHVVRGGTAKAGKPVTFALVNGANVVRVEVGDLGADLYQVSTPADSKVVPKVKVDGSNVVAELRETGRDGPAIVTVVLSDDVRWGVRLAGGASDQTVDLTGGTAGGDVDFVAGTSRAEVMLPAAHGTQRVTVGGGASQLLVHLTGAAPVRVATGNGAGDVTVDGQTRSGVSGGSVFVAPGWDTATDRFEVDATSGVSSLTVARS